MDRLRALQIAPEAPGLPKLAWCDELAQVSEFEGLQVTLCGGRQATRSAIGARLGQVWDVVLWAGHGGPGRLMAADGPVGAEWLACMMRQSPPGVAILSACYSGVRDETLHSLPESLSQSSITTVGMWVKVEDRAAVVYDVEFLRAYVSGRSVATAHRVAVAQVAMEYPAMAGAAFLLPGLVNGYGKIEKRLDGIEGALCQQAERLARIERTLSTLPLQDAEALGIEGALSSG